MQKQLLLRAASAVALIAAMGTSTIAQTGGSGPSSTNPGGSPAQSQQRPQQDAPPSSERGEQQRPETPSPRASDRAQEKSTPKAERQGQRDTPKASERAQEKASPKSAVGENKADENRRTTGERDKDGKDRQRQSGERTKDSKDQQRRSEDRTPDRSKSATDRDQRDGDRTRQGQAGDRSAGERVQLSEQQRTSVRDRLTRSAQGNRLTNVNFTIRVGASVPRNVTLVTLPPDIIEIVPEYRGYQYLYADDSILIVDSNYMIVAVLGSDSRSARRPGGRLTVSSDDRVFIRRHVDSGFAVRLGIGGISIGSKLPANVELRRLPFSIAERVPDLRDYSYFVHDDDIIVVDPDTREVVLVIED